MKNKKLWFRLIFVVVLILIIVYTLRDSMTDIIAQLKTTPLQVVAAICLASVIYHLVEAWITYSLAKKYNPRFTYLNAINCAFFSSFYRLSTLGSGAGVAAIVFLGKKGVGYEEATGLYTVQYMMHKVSIAVYSGIFFIINWHLMAGLYKRYAVYLFLAYVLTTLIAIGLVLFASSPWAHKMILLLLNKLNKKHKLDGAIVKLTSSGKIMEKSSEILLKNPKNIIAMFLKNVLKLCFWYCIPFLILWGTGKINLLTSFSVTSLSVMTAGVIPTPAGIGSTEFVMTSLFSQMVDLKEAATVTVLYRVATFIFPFVVGGILILLSRVVKQLSNVFHQ